MDFWRHLSAHYGTVVLKKAESPLMKACGTGLSLLRLQTRPEFMKRYTTVINRRIYLPYALDEPGSDAALWGRIATAVHEHQHVVQAAEVGFAHFASRYLLSARSRARWEAEAYATEIELMRWAGRTTRTIESIVDGLKAYGCDAPARAEAREELTRFSEANEPRLEATLVAVPWLIQRLEVLPETTHVEPAQ